MLKTENQNRTEVRLSSFLLFFLHFHFRTATCFRFCSTWSMRVWNGKRTGSASLKVTQLKYHPYGWYPSRKHRMKMAYLISDSNFTWSRIPIPCLKSVPLKHKPNWTGKNLLIQPKSLNSKTLHERSQAQSCASPFEMMDAHAHTLKIVTATKNTMKKIKEIHVNQINISATNVDFAVSKSKNTPKTSKTKRVHPPRNIMLITTNTHTPALT